SYLSTQLGLDLTGLDHPYATAISPNGRWIGGLARDPTEEHLEIAWLVDTGASCYANCDGSTTPPLLNIAHFTCLLHRFAAGDPYANCDGSTTVPVLNIADFACFLNTFLAGCP